MKIDIPCSICNYTINSQAFFNDQGYYEITCPQGHQINVALQQQIFEILFEIGLHAINDGYLREAVSSFTACLERFYEFYIKIVCSHNEITSREIEQAWKNVSNSSERQLGAFMFLYFYENREMPKILDSKLVELRNDVIHKGKIPDRNKVINYGQKVLDIINPIIINMKSYYEYEISRYITAYLKKIQNLASVNYILDTCTIVSLNTLDSDKYTVEGALKNLKEYGKTIKFK